ncbi:MAG: hypothetical protein MJZ81_12570, partial [Bacteroidales bacterium]|nr:hypothetical protein [Bacteroidales bacterium]
MNPSSSDFKHLVPTLCPLLWEQLSMANRVRFCHPLFSRFQFIVVFLLMPLGFKQASDVSLLFAIRSLRRACTL